MHCICLLMIYTPILFLSILHDQCWMPSGYFESYLKVGFGESQPRVSCSFNSFDIRHPVATCLIHASVILTSLRRTMASHFCLTIDYTNYKTTVSFLSSSKFSQDGFIRTSSFRMDRPRLYGPSNGNQYSKSSIRKGIAESEVLESHDISR